MRGFQLALRAGGRRRFATVLGVLVVGAMAGAAVSVAYALATGFDRSAREADLPDIVARFSPQDPQRMSTLIAALPNVQSFKLRPAIDDIPLGAGTHFSRKGDLALVTPGRTGYSVVAGRDLTRDDDGALIEQGLAKEWHLRPGDTISLGRGGSTTIRGIVVAPDNVAFPLATNPRVWLSEDAVERRVAQGRFAVSQALIWTHDRSRTDITLQQARATTTGVKDLRVITRGGVRALIDSAAGIVIALLIAFSLIALAAAATLLASQSAAEVQRRARGLGVQLALGTTRRRVAAEQALAAGSIALVAGGMGVALGALAVAGPARDLLATLSERPPGWALVPWLLLLIAVLSVIAAGAAWLPARRVMRHPVADLLRGGDLTRARDRPRRARRVPRAGRSFLGLGARMALARRGRTAATVVALAVSAAVVLLMLGLATLVEHLRDDPGSVGKRYALTVQLPVQDLDEVRGLPGVAGASPRYVVQAVDSYALGETVKLLAFPGDHVPFENPPLQSGRRERAPDEAEIGSGLAAAVGVGVGGILAIQLPDVGEARFRVVGIDRALDADGRIAYVRPDRLLATDPNLTPEIVVKVKPNTSKAAVTRELVGIGARPSSVGGATNRSGEFLDVLASVLRVIAALNALVCLYALAQALALTARERRPALALLRAQGATGTTVLAVLAGAALVLAVPAALIGIALEQLVLGPAVAHLAVGYADLSAAGTLLQSVGILAGLVALGLAAALLAARAVSAQPPVGGLREPT